MPPSRRAAWSAAAITMTAVLGTFGTVLALRQAADLGQGLVVLSVVAVVARYVAEVLFHHTVVGGALLVIALSAPIAVRRFGTTAARLGTLVSLPFMAILTTPAVGPPGPHDGWWAPVVALVAYAWVVAATSLAHVLGLLPPVPRRAPRRTRPGRRLDAGTRMAAQMAVALALALVVGHLVFDSHWPWVVITAYVVGSGNRGRGDVLVKGALRLAGALAGTALATLIAGRLDPGSHTVIVLIFVVLAASTLLRPASYAYWAAGVTAVLALLYGYYGETGETLLAHRLLGIVAGGAIAIAAAWFVLPVRTRDVARLRVAGVLAAVQAVLSTHLDGTEPDTPTLDGAVHELKLVRPTWRIHRRVSRGATRPADALDAVDEVVAATRRLDAASDRAAVGRAARALGDVRRQLRDDDHVTGLTEGLRLVSRCLREALDQP